MEVIQLPVLPRHSECKNCELHLVAKHVGLPTIHLSDSLTPSRDTPAVLFVGRNPGWQEDQKGEVFVGKSGVYLRGGYVKSGGHNGWSVCEPSDPEATYQPGVYIDGISLRSRASVYLTNIVRCYTTADAPPSWSNHLRPCFPHFLADLLHICELHSSVYLMLVSGEAVEAFSALILGAKRISITESLKHNGRRHTLYFHTNRLGFFCSTTPDAPPWALKLPKRKKGDPPSEPLITASSRGFPITLFTTFHPSFVLREPNALTAVEGHLQLLSNALSGMTPSPTRPRLIPVRAPRT